MVEKDMVLAITPRKGESPTGDCRCSVLLSPPEPPFFIREPESLRVLVGSHFLLQCEAMDPIGPVAIQWMEGDNTLTLDISRVEVKMHF